MHLGNLLSRHGGRSSGGSADDLHAAHSDDPAGSAGKELRRTDGPLRAGLREETVITVPSGPTTEDLPETPLEWADFTSRFGSLEHRSGAAIFVAPHHPDYPPTWLTRYYGPLCVGWPGVEARDFRPGEPFRLDYRLWIHRHAAAWQQLREVYAGYQLATQVQWE